MDPYSPPRMTDALKRERLFDLLDAHQDKQNTLITGQAAQGKTTLLATYLDARAMTTVWLPLRSDDQDHAQIFNRLLAAFQKRISPQSASLANSILGTQQAVLRHVETLVQIMSDLSKPTVLVLDDMENLGKESSGFELVRHLVETRFDHLKIFMMSRQMPDLNFAWLKLAKSLFIVTNDDLFFTLDETRAFLSQKPGVLQEDVTKIHQITDGWAGGLTLVSESIRQLKGKLSLPDRLTAEVFNYFSHEIYQQLEKKTQRFLTQTSILDIIDADIVEHLFGTSDMIYILKELENRNLFIQQLESGTSAVQYQYHNLFKEFLVQDLMKAKGQEYVKQLNRKIGLYYWEKRNHETALDYFIRAEAYEDIVRIIKIKGTDLIIRGNYSSLTQWLDCLPEPMVQNDPWLLFFKTMTRRIQGGRKNILQFQNALTMFESENDTRGRLLCVGFLIEAAVFVRQTSSTILEWIAKGETLLKELSKDEHYPWARALLWQHIGLGYIAGSGDLPKGISACRNAILLGQQIDTPDLVMNASIIMTFGHVQAGDFSSAKQMLSRIKGIAKVVENPEYRALKSIVDINFAMNRGQMAEAKKLLNESETDIETFGLIFLYPGFIEAKALQALYTSKFDEAYQLADHLRDFSILEGNDFYEGISARIRATGYFLQKQYTKAKSEINKALESLDPLKKGDIHHYQTLQVGGFIHLYQKDFDRAEKTLSKVQAFFNRMSIELNACETCLALGQTLLECGREDQADEYMIKGLEKARREGYRFFPLIEDDLIINAILRLAAKGLLNDDLKDIQNILADFQSDDILNQMDEFQAGLPKKDKAMANERLLPIYKGVLPQLYIETLGHFNIKLGEQNLDQKRFEGAKPVMLLKAIALHGATDIPKEVLIDDLWPKATAKSGEKNFKINLHRLRKAIEPSPRKEFGYSYILQKAGLVSFDPDLVSLDTDRFNQFVSDGLILEENNQLKKALIQYEDACRLYRGDYFTEEPYQDWISQRRDLFKARYLELLIKKARLHEELDQIDAAIDTWYLALNSDPCFETAYQNLMILFADTGQKSRAVEVFQNCKKVLKEELGSEPDTQTLQIFKQIETR